MLSKRLLMVFLKTVFSILVFGVLVSKESACNAEDSGLIPGLGISSGEGNGYPLQCSGLENSMDCIVRGVAKSDMTKQLSLHFTSRSLTPL